MFGNIPFLHHTHISLSTTECVFNGQHGWIGTKLFACTTSRWLRLITRFSVHIIMHSYIKLVIIMKIALFRETKIIVRFFQNILILLQKALHINRRIMKAIYRHQQQQYSRLIQSQMASLRVCILMFLSFILLPSTYVITL